MTSSVQILQNAATADGNGTPVDLEGVAGVVNVEIVEANTGTCTVTLEGAFNGAASSTWYAVGYQKINGVASPARAATGISVAQGTSNVYQVLDPYPQLRARVSSSSSETVTVKAYVIP